jgi:exosortase B
MTIPARTLPDSLMEVGSKAQPDWMLQVGLWLLCYVLMYVPLFVSLAGTTWATEQQSHGPMIMMVCAWLLWNDRSAIFAGPRNPALLSGGVILAATVAVFVVARSQGVVELDALSQIGMLVAGLLLIQGPAALRRAWFPLFFLLFAVPLPGAWVQAATLPLKQAVSVVAEQLLYWAGYPVGRSGVTLTIGPYALLVADACSGLNSLFTLEALGLLYMKVMRYQSTTRNVMLALMIVPISFVSNVTRVLILVLITFYLGDEAGQGFAHEFAGMVLFSVALGLIYGFDRLWAARFDDKGGARGHV